MSLEDVVKITVGGRITLPKETREALGWVLGTKLKVILQGHRVILVSVKESEG